MTNHAAPVATATRPTRSQSAPSRPAPRGRDTGDFARLRALVLRVRDGDRRAPQQLYAELYPWLRAYYRRRLTPDLVDDAVQEAAIAIHRSCHSYDSERPFACWLVAIATRKWADQLRQLHRCSADELPADLAEGCHENAVVSALSMDRLLGMLRPAQAAAIRLVKLSGLTVVEAAEATGQSTSLVKVNIHRGLTTLRGLIETAPDSRLA